MSPTPKISISGDPDPNQIHPSTVVLQLVPNLETSDGKRSTRWSRRSKPVGQEVDGQGLTPRLRKILQVINETLSETGRTPTTREISDAAGGISPAAIRYQLEILEEGGFIKKSAEYKAHATNPKAKIELITPTKRSLRFPSDEENLVAFLGENMDIDTSLVLGGLDRVIEEIVITKLNPLLVKMKKDLNEKSQKKLINSLSATGTPGIERTSNVLSEIFDSALAKGSNSELTTSLREEVDEYRKAKTYVYNQNKCINSFLNLVTPADPESNPGVGTLLLKTPEDVEKWAHDLIKLWKKSNVINSEKSLGTYQNVFKKFASNSIPEFTYGEFLVIELRKYLSIEGYEKFNSKFQEFGELSWQERALCAQTDPSAFFPEQGGSTREAKRVCMSCDVRIECLDYALRHEETFGIWGGLSERERKRLAERSLKTVQQITAGGSNYLSGLRRLGEYLGLIDAEIESGGVNRDEQIKTFHPKSFSEGRNIGEALRAGHAVIMNCTEMNEDDRKRIIDFVSGLIFANGGSIERVSNKVFLLTPSQDVIISSNLDMSFNQSLTS